MDEHTSDDTNAATILTTQLETTTISMVTPDNPFFTPQVLMGIAIASAVGLLLLLAILVGVSANRNKRRLKSYDNDDVSGSRPSDLNNEDLQYSSEPNRQEDFRAYSNTGLDAMGDEGIEVDLDPTTEDRMKQLVATFNSGPYQPRHIRANFDRQSFYADHQALNAAHATSYENSNPYSEGRHNSFTFFSGDLPTTPL